VSLLDSGALYEPCTVYLEESYTDEDGNELTRASETGTPATARFDVQGQSGTSSRRSEGDKEGFETEKVYSIRFPRSFPHVLGAQSQIQWNEERWVVFGDINRYNRSPRTAHSIYTIKRY